MKFEDFIMKPSNITSNMIDGKINIGKVITEDSDVWNTVITKNDEDFNDLMTTTYGTAERTKDIQHRCNVLETRINYLESETLSPRLKDEVQTLSNAFVNIKANAESMRKDLLVLRSQLEVLAESQKRKADSKILNPISPDLDFPVKFANFVFDYDTFIENLYKL
jgi:hypothetical protein